MKTLSIIILLLLPWLSQAQSSGNELPVTRVLPISEAHTTSLMFRLQLDFKDTDANGNFRLNQYHQNYGYDIDATLTKHPIKELQNESHKEDLINSLKKGNLQSATFIKDGQEVKQYIEANPQFKALTVYDADKKRLDTRQSNIRQQSQDTGKEQKQSHKEKAGADDDPQGEEKQKKQRRKSRSI